MNTSLAIKVLRDLEIVNDEAQAIIFYNGKAFNVSPIVSRLLYILKDEVNQSGNLSEGKIIGILRELLNERLTNYNTDAKLFENYLEQLESLFNKLDLISDLPSKHSNYIKMSITLFSDKMVNKIANVFKNLIPGPIFFYVILFLFSLLNFLYFFRNSLFVNYFIPAKHIGESYSLSVLDIFYFYISFFIILIFHEIGHASALAKFGRMPKSIGFGFYMIFPVLYADVTEAWLMNKQSRVIVNLSGVYMQLLVGSLLIFISAFLPPNLVFFIKKLTDLNVVVILYSLMPFFRSDGYWIYSDLFGIRNLLNSSTSFLKSLIHNTSEFKNTYFSDSGKLSFYALFFYSISNFVFWHYLLYKWSVFFISSFNSALLNIQDGALSLQVLLHFCVSVFFGYFIVRGSLSRWGVLFSSVY